MVGTRSGNISATMISNTSRLVIIIMILRSHAPLIFGSFLKYWKKTYAIRMIVTTLETARSICAMKKNVSALRWATKKEGWSSVLWLILRKLIHGIVAQSRVKTNNTGSRVMAEPISGSAISQLLHTDMYFIPDIAENVFIFDFIILRIYYKPYLIFPQVPFHNKDVILIFFRLFKSL